MLSCKPNYDLSVSQFHHVETYQLNRLNLTVMLPICSLHYIIHTVVYYFIFFILFGGLIEDSRKKYLYIFSDSFCFLFHPFVNYDQIGLI